MNTREQAEIAALDFLRRTGPHTMGPINDENEMCAALIFIGLKQRGLVIAGIRPDRITYRITRKGIGFLFDNGADFDPAAYYAAMEAEASVKSTTGEPT